MRTADIRLVRSRYKKNLRLGAALQLDFLAMCGRPLNALQRLLVDLLQHLGKVRRQGPCSLEAHWRTTAGVVRPETWIPG